MFRRRYITVVFIVVALFIGFLVGRSISSVDDRLPPYYGCNQIARWHADYLMREYGVEFNTNSDNPKRDTNKKAGELNGKLLEICMTDPTK